MTHPRRDFLKQTVTGLAALGAIWALRPPLVAGLPNPETNGSANPLGQWLRFRHGLATLTVLLDGYFEMPVSFFEGEDAALRSRRLRRTFQDFPEYRGAVQALAVEWDDRLVLVDAGGGPGLGKSMGHLPAAMKAAGLDPARVNAVLVTHLHPDHIGGLLDAQGTPAFPNAEILVPEAERKFWLDPASAAAAGADAAWLFALARRVLDAYAKRTSFLPADAQLPFGGSILPLYGHTPGHSGFRLELGDEPLLVIADLVHAPALQLPNPAVRFKMDVDAGQATDVRARTLEALATDDAAIFGMHFPFAGLGRIERARTGYAFTPRAYDFRV